MVHEVYTVANYYPINNCIRKLRDNSKPLICQVSFFERIVFCLYVAWINAYYYGKLVYHSQLQVSTLP